VADEEGAIIDAPGGGRPLEGLQPADRSDSALARAAVGLAESFWETDREQSFASIESLVDSLTAGEELDAAAEVLTSFLNRAPHHTGALTRLVEVHVDRGDEQGVRRTQLALCEAYRVAGRHDEARAIADGFRSPDEPARERRTRAAEVEEEDLSAELDALVDVETEALPVKRPTRASSVPAGAVPAVEDAGLRGFHEEVSRHRFEQEADQHIRLAHTYREMGMMEDAIAAFEAAARSPRHRFEAARQIGKLYRARGMPGPAAEWLDAAAEMPAPSIDLARDVLFDLAEALTAAGEKQRALALLQDLQSESFSAGATRSPSLTHKRAGG
jgi:tetratricopeptide (TPR) repeat protein